MLGTQPTGPAFGRPDDKLRDEAIDTFFSARWIASRSLSSGAHSRHGMAGQKKNKSEASLSFEVTPARREALQESGSAPRSRTQRTSVWLVFGLDAKRAEPNFQDELPTAAAPEILIVSMPPLPRAACDIKDDDHSNHKGDDKNENRMIHRNLACCQN
jgi:hypothetical protein